jgi:DNA modification methylase
MGDLSRYLYYEEDGITLYCGDCREVLPLLRCPNTTYCLEACDGRCVGVDLVLTDPPYGMQYHGQSLVTAKANVKGDGARAGVRVFRGALHDVVPLMKADAHFYTFCHWESWPDFYDVVSPFLPIKSALIWWKNRGGVGDTEMEYARDYEVVLFAAFGRRALAGRRDGAVTAGIPPCGNDREHPTEKPEELMTRLITKSAPEGGLVLDPFAGAGTVLIAAKSMGRRAIGIEIEERYCAIAVKRLRQGVLNFGTRPR